MKTLLRDRLMSGVVFAPENEGGTPAPADTASVLYGDEGGGGDAHKPAGLDKDGKPAETDTKAAEAGEWKEYENDPAKSDEENAAAKAEHDKTKPADDKNDPANKVPEDGKYDLKMPDGVEVDAELLAAIGPDFKELGLTNAQAQKLADKFIEVQTARMGKQSETWAATVTGWVDTAKADKEIGGDKWDATVSSAQRAVNKLGTPELKEYFEASGGGNHPELIRFMAKVGAMIKEDNPASGNAAGKAGADRVETLYPDDKPKGN